ncbi:MULTISPECIES: oxidoreductase [unclassified Bacillus (in: firmicutes)]|uniref:oxidoreductase n=1 Tax=unclassified Bacillus (in: firmicutes) TaxID=185979 RepID=UPI00232D2694|nr:oxidoreductase [Bacillus sp. BP-3]MDC2864327.1 oxidoreductase [Bacillus sp. BP-3]
MTEKIAIITGSSSGFGLLTSLEFAKKNYLVIATMRNIEKQTELMKHATSLHIEQNINIHQLDVTSKESIREFTTFINNLGQIDILVNNAGYASGGFVEEIPIEEYRKQFETNVFGAIAVTQAVLPIMRRQKHGKIINISSISGKIGFPGLSPYVTSKYALEGWSESLRLEVKPFGIDVSLIEPGSYNTNIWEVGQKLAEANSESESPYKEYMKKIEQHIHNGSENFGDPQDVAEKIVSIAQSQHPTLRYPIGKGVKLMILLKNLLPWKWWEFLVLRRFK